MPSPTPMKRRAMARFGDRRSRRPLALPSSLVMMRPVSPSASSNALHLSQCVPGQVVPSSTSNLVRALSIALPMTRFAFFNSSIRWSCVGRRPAVSHITTSVPRAFAGGHGVEHHRRRVATGLLDHGDVVAFAPDRELLARRRAKVSPAASSTLCAVLLQVFCKLADAGRLAGAATPAIAMTNGDSFATAAVQRLQQICQGIHQHRRGSPCPPACFQRLRRVVKQVLGRRHAAIGHQQLRFQLLQRVFIKLAGKQHLEGELVTCGSEAGLELVEPALSFPRARRLPRAAIPVR